MNSRDGAVAVMRTSELLFLLKVYLYEDEAEQHRSVEASPFTQAKLCVSPSEYYTLLTSLIIAGICLLACLVVIGVCYR